MGLGTIMKLATTIMKWAIALAAMWYGVVIFVLPSHFNGVPAYPSWVKWQLLGHSMSVTQGKETFGDLDGPTLRLLVTAAESQHNPYHVAVFANDDGETAAIVAYPEKHRGYKHGFLHRLVFLDFAKRSYNSFLLQNDGMYCEGHALDLSSANPPSAEQASPDVDGWEPCWSVPEWLENRKAGADPGEVQ
jgi:hypothetical protein